VGPIPVSEASFLKVREESPCGWRINIETCKKEIIVNMVCAFVGKI